MMNTVTLECCFSAVKLPDNPLCSRRTADQTNKIITIYKEGKAVQGCDRSDKSLFDSDLAVVFLVLCPEKWGVRGKEAATPSVKSDGGKTSFGFKDPEEHGREEEEKVEGSTA